MVTMSQMSDHDWVTEEGEAVLAADPELRARLERQLAEDAAGTLTTIPDSVVRARMAELRAAQRSKSR